MFKVYQMGNIFRMLIFAFTVALGVSSILGSATSQQRYTGKLTVPSDIPPFTIEDLRIELDNLREPINLTEIAHKLNLITEMFVKEANKTRDAQSNTLTSTAARLVVKSYALSLYGNELLKGVDNEDATIWRSGTEKFRSNGISIGMSPEYFDSTYKNLIGYIAERANAQNRVQATHKSLLATNNNSKDKPSNERREIFDPEPAEYEKSRIKGLAGINIGISIDTFLNHPLISSKRKVPVGSREAYLATSSSNILIHHKPGVTTSNTTDTDSSVDITANRVFTDGSDKFKTWIGLDSNKRSLTGVEFYFYKNALVEIRTDFVLGIEDILTEKYGNPIKNHQMKYVTCQNKFGAISRELDGLDVTTWGSRDKVQIVKTVYFGNCAQRNYFEISIHDKVKMSLRDTEEKKAKGDELNRLKREKASNSKF